MKPIIIIMLLALFCLNLYSTPLSSLYSDHKSFSIGDVLTVVISETSSAKSASQNETGKSFDHSFDTDSGKGPFDVIPLSGFGVKGNNASKGDAKTTREGSFKTKMTVRIIDIDDNGNLFIKGSKAVTINGEEELTQLEGMVRSQDVGSDNTLNSFNIADAKISYLGKGTVAQGSKVGLISRIFNYIF